MGYYGGGAMRVHEKAGGGGGNVLTTDGGRSLSVYVTIYRLMSFARRQQRRGLKAKERESDESILPHARCHTVCLPVMPTRVRWPQGVQITECCASQIASALTLAHF